MTERLAPVTPHGKATTMAIVTDQSSNAWLGHWAFPPARSRSEDETICETASSFVELRHHARRTADRHRIDGGSSPNQLRRWLDESIDAIQGAHRALTLATQQGRDISEAGRWLLDNHHLIRDKIRGVRRDLPRKYAKGLPRLTAGPCEGLPRVYDLALEFIGHVDGPISQDALHAFVSAYQDVSLLTLRELWAIPIMLRLAGIETLRRMAIIVVQQHADAEKGRAWAERLSTAQSTPDEDAVAILREMVTNERPLTSGLIARFTRRLSELTPASSMAATWLGAVSKRAWRNASGADRRGWPKPSRQCTCRPQQHCEPKHLGRLRLEEIR